MINNMKNILFNNIVNNIVNKTFESSVKIIKTQKNDSKFNHINNDISYLLYLHIPFCDNLCPFCTFHKYSHNMKTSTKYFENLREEIKILKSHNVKIDSIYIGGGSPLINDVELLKTLKLLKKCFDVDDVSCETDPNHIEVETVKKLKGYVRRLSIGVQSFNDTLLKQLGRFDKFGDSKSLIKKIKAVQGILPMTNIDLIFNLPNQTEQMLRNDLKIAKSVGVEQVVAYPLMSSTLNSKFTNRFEPNNNKEHFYNIINEELKDYHANNMWSFSRDKVNMNDEYISTHNEYIGLGSGAFSYLEGKLFINAFDLEKYEELLKTKKDTILAKSEFSKKNVIQYYILCTLFSGTFDIKAYNKKFKISLEKVLGKELFILKNFGIIYIEDDVINLTKKGRYILTVMMSNFYSQMDKVRALFRNKSYLFD